MNNISIDGFGNFSGGEYGAVCVDGVASCPDDITCETVSVDGTFHCHGNLSAKKVSSDGAMNVGGSLTTELISVDGAASVGGDLTAQKLSVDGSLSVSCTLHAERVSVDGSLSVQGEMHAPILAVDGSLSAHTLHSEQTNVDGSLRCVSFFGGRLACDGSAYIEDELSAKEVVVDGSLKVTNKLEAETIRADGSLSTDGQISADRIEIDGEVCADEIVGDYIRIAYDPVAHTIHQIKDVVLHALFKRGTSEQKSCANLIEATTVEIDNVTAGTVSGEHVTIGENCRIERLECTGTYTIDSSSYVGCINGEPHNT